MIVVSLIGFAYLSLRVLKDLIIVTDPVVPKPEICPLKMDDHISCGEESLFHDLPPLNKKYAMKYYHDKRYDKASRFFEISFQQESQDDPETLIYWNNAKLKTDPNIKPYTIAVGIPITGDKAQAKKLLGGIAHAQNNINHSQAKINGRPLRILIADDHNESESVLSKFIAYYDGEPLEGCVDTPEGEAFCDQASKTQINWRTANSYDAYNAIMTIAKALETLPNPNRVKLQEALRRLYRR
ncbi:MAG: hypothetical protein F6K38_37800 [Moorea sp. SIO3B2]|nr:hypothetical protein [Moorena sp. SIO3B2]